MKQHTSQVKASGRRKTLAKKATSCQESQARIFELLKADHRRLQSLCEKILKEESGATEDAQDLFEEFKTLLTSHAKAEETVFYDLIKERTEADGNESGHVRVLEGFEEHHVADLLLEELSELNRSDERWIAKMTVLSEALDHHIEEEEGEIFKNARKEIDKDEFARLGLRFEQEKRALILSH